MHGDAVKYNSEIPTVNERHAVGTLEPEDNLLLSYYGQDRGGGRDPGLGWVPVHCWRAPGDHLGGLHTQLGTRTTDN